MKKDELQNIVTANIGLENGRFFATSPSQKTLL